MLKALTTILSIAVLTTALTAQGRQPSVADFAGTWNIELMSHQIALVIDPQEANTVTATLMIMGRDVPLEGELVDRTIALVGIPGETTSGGHVVAKPGTTGQAITVTLQEDGTIAGEMMTSQGPAKWTGEKLKTRKKPQP